MLASIEFRYCDVGHIPPEGPGCDRGLNRARGPKNAIERYRIEVAGEVVRVHNDASVALHKGG